MTDEHAHHCPDFEPEGDFEFSNGKLAMWLFLVSDAMAFIGFLGAYMVLRLGAEFDPTSPGWLPAWAPKLDVFLTGLNTFVLIFSSVTMVKAFASLQDGQMKRFKGYLMATVLGGTFFVGFQCFEWTHLIHSGVTMQGLVLPDLDTAMERAEDKGLDITRLEMATMLFGKRDVSDLDPEHFTEQEYLDCDLLLKTDFEDDERPLVPGIIHRPDFGVPRQGHTTWVDGKPVKETTRDLMTSADLRDLPADELHASGARISNLFASSFYLLTGFHGFHVLIGVIYMLVLWCRAHFLNAYDKDNSNTIEIAGLYWHFVDLVWVLLFMLIYLI